MGHDSYEFMGRLYPHRFQDWLKGEPWYFYFVLITTKLPILTLFSFALGLGLLFRQRAETAAISFALVRSSGRLHLWPRAASSPAISRQCYRPSS